MDNLTMTMIVAQELVVCNSKELKKNPKLIKMCNGVVCNFQDYFVIEQFTIWEKLKKG